MTLLASWCTKGGAGIERRGDRSGETRHHFQSLSFRRSASRRAVERWWFRRPLFCLGRGFFGPRLFLGYLLSFTRRANFVIAFAKVPTGMARYDSQHSSGTAPSHPTYVAATSPIKW